MLNFDGCRCSGGNPFESDTVQVTSIFLGQMGSISIDVEDQVTSSYSRIARTINPLDA